MPGPPRSGSGDHRSVTDSPAASNGSSRATSRRGWGRRARQPCRRRSPFAPCLSRASTVRGRRARCWTRSMRPSRTRVAGRPRLEPRRARARSRRRPATRARATRARPPMSRRIEVCRLARPCSARTADPVARSPPWTDDSSSRGLAGTIHRRAACRRRHRRFSPRQRRSERPRESCSSTFRRTRGRCDAVNRPGPTCPTMRMGPTATARPPILTCATTRSAPAMRRACARGGSRWPRSSGSCSRWRRSPGAHADRRPGRRRCCIVRFPW